MNAQQKRLFISDLMESIKQNMLSKVDSMPEEWDGIELRWYIADTAAEQAAMSSDYDRGDRRKAYRNTVITRNL